VIPRVGIVVSHPIQHFCPLYTALALDGRIDLTVLFASKVGAKTYFDKGFQRNIRWKEDLLAGFKHDFLPGADQVEDTSRSIHNRALEDLLARERFDVVVAYGLHHGISRTTYAWARGSGARSLLIADSELRTRRSLATRIRKRLTLPWLLRRIDGFLTVGDSNEAYYRHYGVEPARMFRSPFPIDEVVFDRALASRDLHRTALRDSLKLKPDDCLALVVGKLTKLKRPLDVVKAARWAAERDPGHRIHVLFAGDGPERQAVLAGAGAGTDDLVAGASFVEAAELPKYYLAADMFVHPSEEDRHPLAITEAISAGLPCIVSDRVGCVGPTDDLRVGENGWDYPVGDIAALGRRMLDLASDERLRGEMGARSTAIASQRRMSTSVNGFVEAVLAKR